MTKMYIDYIIYTYTVKQGWIEEIIEIVETQYG